MWGYPFGAPISRVIFEDLLLRPTLCIESEDELDRQSRALQHRLAQENLLV